MTGTDCVTGAETDWTPSPVERPGGSHLHVHSASSSRDAAWKDNDLPKLSSTFAAPGLLRTSSLMELIDGLYLLLAEWADATTLCRADAVCRQLYKLNGSHRGPWHELGVRTFHGLDLGEDGIFELDDQSCDTFGVASARCLWKQRYIRFRTQLMTLRSPFRGREIIGVEHPDEVAYFRCHLRMDMLSVASCGIYIEVEVLRNPDNLSIAVVDFDDGGCSSMTFSPAMGAVIIERRVSESPKKVEGSYIQPLPALPPGERFHGLLGLYAHQGRLAFLRRLWSCIDGEPCAWESTGFVSGSTWAAGVRLIPCMAFRSQGAYQLRVTRVDSKPPDRVRLEDAAVDSPESGWKRLDWEEDDAFQTVWGI